MPVAKVPELNEQTVLPSDKDYGYLAKAYELIASVKLSSPCASIAIEDLLASCQGLEVGTASQEMDDHSGPLEQVRTIYAARLAICEITEAGASLPSQCAAMAPQACRSSRWSPWLRKQHDLKSHDRQLCFAPTSQTQLMTCLRALEARAQWWTSYSNARQNAVIMCQASRHTLEMSKSEVK